MLSNESKGDIPKELIIEEAIRELEERTGIKRNDLAQSEDDIADPVVFFTSPGSLSERVHAIYIKIKPNRSLREMTGDYTGGLATKGNIRPIETSDIFTTSELGGIASSRLEQMAYELSLTNNRHIGSSIGDKPKLSLQNTQCLKVLSAAGALKVPEEIVFEETKYKGDFLAVYQSAFDERNASGEIIGEVVLEHAEPVKSSGLSSNKTIALPLIKTLTADGSERFLVGLEKRSLPAVQIVTQKTAWIVTAPGTRIPLNYDTHQAVKHTLGVLREKLGAKVIKCFPVGVSVFSSNGTTAEEITPLLVEIDAKSAADSNLRWTDLEDLFKNRHLIQDSMLKTLVYRATHAFGLLR